VPKAILGTSDHRSSMPVVVFYCQGIISYFSFVVTIALRGTVIQLQAVKAKK